MTITDPWDNSLPYEPFMGRWSRKIAPLFLDWLDAPSHLRWLEVGCGTGALTTLIATRAHPQALLAIDPSEIFIAHAQSALASRPNVRFEVAGAAHIPAPDHTFDIAVSALALNFFPDPVAGLQEMCRAVTPGGTIALYVWDYAAGMEMLRVFWDTAVALNPAAQLLDEAVRFPLCRPAALEKACADAGLTVAEILPLDAPTIFSDFADYWQPFLGGVGPAPGYVATLNDADRTSLSEALQAVLPIQQSGTIALKARAWTVRAFTPRR